MDRNVDNDILSEEDRFNVQAFNLLVMSNIPRQAFEQLRFAFRDKLQITSEYTIFHRMHILSGVNPVIYDCCPNSCVSYTKKFIYYQACPYCNELRFKNGKARRSFVYFPLIPRLRGYFRSTETIEKMSYRSCYQSRPGKIANVFDRAHYQRLLQHRVIVDGVKLGHRHFSGPHDIALSLCTDSFLLFRRRRKGPSATPILIQNYNLCPQIRTHLRNLIWVGIIPGPKQPKDLESFLLPLDDEAAELAYGVKMFHAVRQTSFDLHAYFLFKLGDIVAVEKFLNIKCHNAIYPCRSCAIQAIRGMSKAYYVPLDPPKNIRNAGAQRWDPAALPLWQHEDFIETATRIHTAATKAAKEQIAKNTGIQGLPAMSPV